MFAKRLKAFFWLCVLIGGGALIYLPSFSRYQELKREETQIDQKIEEVSGSLTKLLEEERLLKNDEEYVEKVARDNLGRVRPGETVYRIIPSDEKNGNAQASAEKINNDQTD